MDSKEEFKQKECEDFGDFGPMSEEYNAMFEDMNSGI